MERPIILVGDTEAIQAHSDYIDALPSEAGAGEPTGVDLQPARAGHAETKAS